MMKSCIAIGCKSKLDKRHPEIRFHRFPINDKERCEKWVLALKRDNWRPSMYSYLCSEHFVEEDYKPFALTGKHELKKDAVPTVFDYSQDAQKPDEEKQSANKKSMDTKPPVKQVYNLPKTFQVRKRKLSTPMKLELSCDSNNACNSPVSDCSEQNNYSAPLSTPVMKPREELKRKAIEMALKAEEERYEANRLKKEVQKFALKAEQERYETEILRREAAKLALEREKILLEKA